MANQNQKKNKEDFSLKETTPNISAGRVISGDRLPTAFDLVEQMPFLFARVVRAKELPENSKSHACNPYVEVKLGSFVGTTKSMEKTTTPEWNQVFAFAKDRIQELVLQIVVKNKDNNGDPDGFMGHVTFTISDIPMRVPPDSPLAPQWYKLEDQNGLKLHGELMVSVWMGTQADEGFPEAWHSDAAEACGENIAHTRSKVYISPRLWYLRVNVIQGQDLLLKNKGGNNSEIFIQGVLGNLALRSRSMKGNTNPMWNEDLMFVAAEPFDDSLVVSIEQGNSHKHESLGCCVIPLKNVQHRIDATPPASVWYNLHKPKENEGEEEIKFSSKLNMRISLDGGYHVLDEATQYSSDLRPSSKNLCKPSIGVLELGILNAVGLSPMKKDNHTDAYCVAKYGPKWVRTRTIVDSLSPKWNEQYTWEVFDLCTVITIVVFDNGNLHGGKNVGGKNAGGKNTEREVDKRIGKVRIRLSTLESDRIYTHSYPLINLHTQGARKMGEIQLAVRFSCPSLLNVLQTYAQPLLPRMHYICPLSVYQLDSLRNQAAAITTLRFKRAEPTLSKEVVDYMLDMRANVWSMRRGRAQFSRITSLLSGLVCVGKQFDDIRVWKNSVTTVFSYFMFLFVIFFPGIILPSTFSFLLMVGIWRYRTRPRYPYHMDVKLSQADTATVEELEEEFDPFPSKFNGENLRKRYDGLRGVAGRVLEVMSDLATQGERVHSLLSWRDPRATVLFVIFCLVAIIVTYFVPFRIIMFLGVTYLLRPPRFRFDMPAVPQNFLRRMPAKSDGML
ncbi:FT-interacting protein 7-like [Abrus precatorius]|uniref:FT-interacting protein 7-like n=1 Tax=Abrus precatorius TaxID=3816 RepID=A0A8B8KIG6_ABRPR|nr:FT-interacting protein 7-like [Abrus precatorius]